MFRKSSANADTKRLEDATAGDDLARERRFRSKLASSGTVARGLDPALAAGDREYKHGDAEHRGDHCPEHPHER